MSSKHHWRRWLWFLPALNLLLGVGLPAGAHASTTSNVVIILGFEGVLEVSRAGSERWDPARTNQVLDPGDRFRTGPDSRATVRMFDRTVVRIDQRSLFQVERPPEDQASILLRLVRGVLYLFHREAPGSVRVHSLAASAATRGTEFSVAVDEISGQMTLSLFEGMAEMTNAAGSLLLTNRQQGVALPGQAPARSPVLKPRQLLQWCLYYPGVLHVDEAGLDDEARRTLEKSLTAYRAGNLLEALRHYPPERQPATDPERLYRAALGLSVGRVSEAQALLEQMAAGETNIKRLQLALRLVITTVVDGTARASVLAAGEPLLATEWLAQSLALQSQGELEPARQAARRATEVAPGFGFAWARLAELEFSHAQVRPALLALDHALVLSPQHAQALSLRAFTLAAMNRVDEALLGFERAIAQDSALANAWLGRGLCRIRLGQYHAGREDLQVAAALEPTRALLRSYLGKGYNQEGDRRRAFHELALAKELDPGDPTAWLYAALLSQENNRINDAVRNLEHSIERNDNRQLYRSSLLLDQDRAVRGANLARIYHEAGMTEVSVREATRAVNADYANGSAHLFLANSFDALRDPNQVDLRYETAWFSEHLLANLLAPVGASTLSPLVSQQEYSRFFERDRAGLVSSSEYFSNGDWHQQASQFGRSGDTSYAVDLDYRDENGQRPNNDQEQLSLWLQLKQQLGPQDSLLLQTIYYHAEGGDLTPRADPRDANRGFRFEENQEPLVLAGLHHAWNPQHHSLLLAARLHDKFEFSNPTQPELLLYQTNGQTALVPAPPFSSTTNRYKNELEIWSGELQHIWQGHGHSLIAGSRLQAGQFETDVRRLSNSSSFLLVNPSGGVSVVPPVPSQTQDVDTDFQRSSVYAYYNRQILDPLQLSAGVSYDHLRYPRNIVSPPLSDQEDTADQWSPKLGVTWQPGRLTTVRGGYTRSLGGMSLDQSVRLEPTQVAGFNQAFRSLMPESVVGNIPAAEFDAFGFALEHQFKTDTYLTVEGRWLESEADRLLGATDLTSTFPPLMFQFAPGDTRQRLDFEEQTLLVTLNQLVSEEWSGGVRYRLSHADLQTRFPDIPASAVTSGNLPVHQNLRATLHQLDLFALIHLPAGFFGRWDTLWTLQTNDGDSPEPDREDFWQSHVRLGYRLPGRRLEVSAGVLNLFDQDYRLNPLNVTSELPRERTFTTALRFYF